MAEKDCQLNIKLLPYGSYCLWRTLSSQESRQASKKKNIQLFKTSFWILIMLALVCLQNTVPRFLCIRRKRCSRIYRYRYMEHIFQSAETNPESLFRKELPVLSILKLEKYFNFEFIKGYHGFYDSINLYQSFFKLSLPRPC